MLESVVGPMLAAREALGVEFAKLHRAVLAIVRADAVCRRLMTASGVGAVVALTFKSGVDDPKRFKSSKLVGAHFGLTPRRYQSGETDIVGGISRAGDAMVRTALYEAAQIILTRAVRFSTLKRWGLDVAKRRGLKRATVALARKLATVPSPHVGRWDRVPLEQGRHRGRIGDRIRARTRGFLPIEVPSSGREVRRSRESDCETVTRR